LEAINRKPREGFMKSLPFGLGWLSPNDVTVVAPLLRMAKASLRRVISMIWLRDCARSARVSSKYWRSRPA
jgi:hypothetical protein